MTSSTQCEHDENMMPPHSYVDEWNMNTGDDMVMWFASYANLVTSQWACVSLAHVH